MIKIKENTESGRKEKKKEIQIRKEKKRYNAVPGKKQIAKKTKTSKTFCSKTHSIYGSLITLYLRSESLRPSM